MKPEEVQKKQQIDSKPQENLTPYIPPRIATYTSEQILEQLGPAMTCAGSVGCASGY